MDGPAQETAAKHQHAPCDGVGSVIQPSSSWDVRKKALNVHLGSHVPSHQPARPASAGAGRQQKQTCAECRPATASGIRPRPAAAARHQSSKHDATEHGINAERIGTPKQKKGTHSSTPLARLKAELAELAAIGNVQLQSLRPSTAPGRIHAQSADASAALQAQVLDSLQSLQQNMALTYTEARKEAAAGQADTLADPPDQTSDLKADDAGRSGQQDTTGKDPLSLFMAELTTTSEEQEAAAVASLQEMRAWVAKQEMRMVDSSVAARYRNKTVAARISALKSETQVLQYQRHFYEDALAQLRAKPGFAGYKEQHQQQDWLIVGEANGDIIEGEVVYGPKSQDRQLHHGYDHSLAVWADRSDNSSSHESNLGSHAVWDEHPLHGEPSSHQGYFGSNLLTSKAKVHRSVSSGAKVLQLSHIGLSPNQLDKVTEALKAAPQVQRLDLSGNMLTDASIGDLVTLLVSSPDAAHVTGLDLSDNQLLTCCCCGALRDLLVTQGAASSGTIIQPAAKHAVGMAAARLCCSGAALNSNATNLSVSSGLVLTSLSLEGLNLGDKGARELAAALRDNQHLQVLHLAQCGLHDAGGAAICSAIQHHPAMYDLDLSWNALAHATAIAVEMTLRCNLCPLSCLRLSHCGIDDRDASVILDALIPRGAGTSSSVYGVSSNSNHASISSSGDHGSWTCIDLSHNSLEGGAAICAAAVVNAIMATTKATNNSCSNGDGAGLTIASASSEMDHSNGFFMGEYARRGRCSNVSVRGSSYSSTGGGGSRGGSAGGSSFGKTLLLDGNPLGASGVKCLMRALAGQPSVGVLVPETYKEKGDNSQQQLPVFVSIAKVTLMAKERGFRSNLRDTQSASVLATQVRLHVDAGALVLLWSSMG
eukprot:GHRR01005940.1.p1 GENE.GHRR01005940.1~~GHRR01005940.1.p1  ORF type:complete len:880 (+),score=289.87 GHRR01005940.1:295-2934(+)